MLEKYASRAYVHTYSIINKTMYKKITSALNADPNLLILVFKHLHETEAAESAYLFLIPDPVFHFPVLLESWTTPWLESVLKIVLQFGGPHTCVAAPSGEVALLCFPSICTHKGHS